MYKSKLKTLNNGYSRRMIELAASSNFYLLAIVYKNYRDYFEEEALLKTLKIVIGVTDFSALFQEYPTVGMEIRSTLNEIYSYAYTLI